ncbi:MAG: endonuclease/exonuclease/phosphatase family protein [Elusimicrobiota bacterium]
MKRLRTIGRALGIALLTASLAQAEAGLVSQYGGLAESAGRQGAKIREQQQQFALQRELAAARRRSVFRILSWNVQTFGDIKPEREAAYEMLGQMFSSQRSSKILAVQEVANDKGSDKFSELLPGGEDRWNTNFQNTNDSQDNGFYVQKSVQVDCEEFLFARADENGDHRSRDDRAKHPARAAHMRVGDFDFTLITLHLTFKGGKTDASAEELKHILRWLEDYFDNPENDPDVILAGDFNMTTRAGATSGSKAALEDIIEQFPTFRRAYDAEGKRVRKPTELIALVDAPTSRYKGEARNNYDHFIVSGDVFDEEFVSGSAGPIPASFIEAAEKKHDVYVSDHMPISAGFLSTGAGNDGEAIRSDQPGPTSSRSCWKRGRK